MRGIGPRRDYWLHAIGEVHLGNYEVAALKEGCHGTTNEQWTENTIQGKAPLERTCTNQVPPFVLEFVAYCLYHKGEKDKHPKPVGTAEASAVEKREGSKECTTEGNQCGERKFPFATGGVE